MNVCFYQSVKAVADDVYNIINLVKLQATVVLSLRISSGRTLLQSWAPTDMGNGGGHLPTPRKVEKCYRVKKLHPEVSLNGLDAIGLGVCNCVGLS